MFGSGILDIAVGVVFIYLLTSLLCTALNEAISGLFSIRAASLKKWLGNLLNDQDLLKQFYNYPLVRNLSKNPGKLPSYIPPNVFSSAVLSIIKDMPQAAQGRDVSQQGLKNTVAALSDPGGSPDKLKADLENYFNDSMERVSGWYKRNVQIIIFGLSLAVCALLNIDTIRMIRQLGVDSNMRAALSGYAVQYVNSGNTNSNIDIRAVRSDMEKIEMPIGWKDYSLEPTFIFWFEKIMGLIISSLAVSLGAPFWFDTLSGIIRLTGKKP